MPKKKAANWEGTIYKRKDGRYEAALPYRTEDGKVKRKRAYFWEKAKADQWLARSKVERDGGVLLDTKSVTFERYLHSWLEDSVAPRVTPRVHDQYASICRTHLIPAFGHLKLTEIRPAHIQRFYRRKAQQGYKHETRKRIHLVLRSSLKQAVRWGELANNPAEYVDPPKVSFEEANADTIHTLTEEQVQLLFRSARGSRFEYLYVVALRTGLRLGELLGLQWSDIDLQASPATLTLKRALALKPGGGYYYTPTKRRGSRRTIPLLDEAAEVLQAQRELLAKEKLTMGDRWQEHGLVFPSTIGTPMNEHNLRYKYFKPLLKEAGLPDITFHDLRHTFATWMYFDNNVDIKTLSELLGHASIATTMNIYAHVLPQTQADAIRRLNKLFSKQREA